MTYKFLFGCTDWRHEEWIGDFYPPDMPEDWWLSFYSTQFRCVWLQRSAWASVSVAQAATWVEDTHEGFRFLLETPDPFDQAASGVLDVLAPRIGLVCGADHPDLLWFDGGTEMRHLADAISGRDSGGPPLHLISRDNDLATLERVATLLHVLGV